MSFPAKTFYRLWGLQERWSVSQEDILHAVQNDMLRTCVWLPLRYVERCVLTKNGLNYKGCEAKEGFVGIRATDCHEICNKGMATLRSFNSVNKPNHVLRLPYEPPQPALYVRTDDLVVLESDLKAFEKTYDITPSNQNKRTKKPIFIASDDYRHIIAHGYEFNLGIVQADMIRHLHDASRSENPWVHSKTLIYQSTSKATRMRDIFTRKEHWEYLIISDKRGYYRLRFCGHSLVN